MMNLDALLPVIRAHAAQEAPRECCGLILADPVEYRPCRNIAPANTTFFMALEDYLAAHDTGRQLLAVVHSHVFEPATPSAADVAACNAGTLPWLIVNHPDGTHQWLHPQPDAPHAPLIGRTFVHGVHDCYSLVRDWYAEQGIALRDYPRLPEWWHAGQNLYRDNFAAEGFAEVPPETLQAGDLLLMRVRSPVENHAAVYLGDNIILHHVMHRPSRREVYGDYWRRHTTAVLRHNSMEAEPC